MQTDIQWIKEIATQCELPLAQVALIWNVIKWYNDEVRDENVALLVETFIDEKFIK